LWEEVFATFNREMADFKELFQMSELRSILWRPKYNKYDSWDFDSLFFINEFSILI